MMTDNQVLKWRCARDVLAHASFAHNTLYARSDEPAVLPATVSDYFKIPEGWSRYRVFRRKKREDNMWQIPRACREVNVLEVR